MGTTVQIGIGNVFAAVGLLLVALSFATDNWSEVTVNRSNLADLGKTNTAINTSLHNNLEYFSRNRGLFRTCLVGADTYLFLDQQESVIDGKCIAETGYELTRNEDTLDFGDDYETRIHLLRAHFAFFVIALLGLAIGCILGAVSCWSPKGSILKAAGLIIFVAAFFTCGGMAFFHGYDYLEKQRIDQDGFPKFWQQDLTLAENAKIRYGYSYFLGWIGMGVSVIAAIIFLCAAYTIQQFKDEERREEKRAEKEQEKKNNKRNKAYDMMDQSQTGYDQQNYNNYDNSNYNYNQYPTYPSQPAGGYNTNTVGNGYNTGYPNMGYQDPVAPVTTAQSSYGDTPYMFGQF